LKQFSEGREEVASSRSSLAAVGVGRIIQEIDRVLRVRTSLSVPRALQLCRIVKIKLPTSFYLC